MTVSGEEKAANITVIFHCEIKDDHVPVISDRSRNRAAAAVARQLKVPLRRLRLRGTVRLLVAQLEMATVVSC
jgi:hypothetical protein